MGEELRSSVWDVVSGRELHERNWPSRERSGLGKQIWLSSAEWWCLKARVWVRSPRACRQKRREQERLLSPGALPCVSLGWEVKEGSVEKAEVTANKAGGKPSQVQKWASGMAQGLAELYAVAGRRV